MKKRVLFICIHNSARSQMAEAFLKNLAGENFEVASAGLEPGVLNPIVVEVMKEIGIDISGNKSKSVQEFVKSKPYHYVITVCDETNAEKCPAFPGKAKRLHWSFPDPSSLEGHISEKLARTREIRDQIKQKIESWLRETQTTSEEPS